MYSFIRLIRSVPPARTSTSPHCAPSIPAASCTVVGLEYAKACMLCVPPLQRRQHPVGAERDTRHAHADGVSDRITNGRDRTYRRRLAEANYAALVVCLRDIQMHHNL